MRPKRLAAAPATAAQAAGAKETRDATASTDADTHNEQRSRKHGGAMAFDKVSYSTGAITTSAVAEPAIETANGATRRRKRLASCRPGKSSQTVPARQHGRL